MKTVLCGSKLKGRKERVRPHMRLIGNITECTRLKFVEAQGLEQDRHQWKQLMGWRKRERSLRDIISQTSSSVRPAAQQHVHWPAIGFQQQVRDATAANQVWGTRLLACRTCCMESTVTWHSCCSCSLSVVRTVSWLLSRFNILCTSLVCSRNYSKRTFNITFSIC